MMRELDILRHPRLDAVVARQAGALLAMHDESPRLSSLFATQQRWLMAHVAAAVYYRAVAAGELGVPLSRIIDGICHFDLSSRNTASSFLKELVKYGMVERVGPASGPRRLRYAPAPATRTALFGWHLVHLASLDGLDDGDRQARLAAAPEAVVHLQPLVTESLLASRRVREPAPTFSLFTWMDEGGIIMDRLIASCGAPVPGSDGTRFLTDVRSISGLAARLDLSRTHAGRKLNEAEAMGSLGWCGRRGRSPLWISEGFRNEYRLAQAAKLAAVEIAFQACFADAEASTASGEDQPRSLKA